MSAHQISYKEGCSLTAQQPILHVPMIDQLDPSFEQTPGTRAFAFIQDRIKAATPAAEEGVVDLLEAGDIKKIFRTLVSRLDGSRKKYKTLGALHDRDKKAAEAASPSLPTESAQRHATLVRPDQGKPSQLEYWFLTILSTDEWREFCETISELTEETDTSGALTLRNVIENVLSDEPRTKAFIAATRERVKRFNSGPIQIYDVGCGPFPVLAIAAALASPEAKVKCIEINPLSAKIAERIVHKLELSGQIKKDQITITIGNALNADLPELGSVDILVSETVGPGLMDEQVTKILPRYARCLNEEKGTAIPARARISAALTPNDKGISAKSRTSKYELVLNTDGEYIPIQPDNDWHALMDADLTKPLPVISGTISYPAHISPRELHNNYSLCIAAELVLDQKGPIKNGKGRRILSRYQSRPTSPASLGLVSVPAELMDEDPKNLEIRFQYEPGSRSDIMANNRVSVERKS